MKSKVITPTILALYIANRCGLRFFNTIGYTPIGISLIPLTIVHCAINNPYKGNLNKGSHIPTKKHIPPIERRSKRKK